MLKELNIPQSLRSSEKLRKLRSASIEEFGKIYEKLKISEFRATTDDAFVSKDLMANIASGDFARRMKKRGIKLMNGECRDEHFSYAAWRTPSSSFEAVRSRLIADYPAGVVDKVLHHYCGEARELPSGMKSWQDLFGRIYADMQVHHLERGFMQKLEQGGMVPGEDLLRYRINWRAKCVDSMFPPEWGVTHGK